jgi:hypothetical protein
MTAPRSHRGAPAGLQRLGWTGLVLALVVTGVGWAAGGPHASPARKVLPPKTWTGKVNGTYHDPGGPTTTWNANVRFELAPRRDPGDYTYRPTGSVTYTISGVNSGDDCTYSGSSTFQISGNDGELGITRKRAGWEYEAFIHLDDEPWIVQIQCGEGSGEAEAEAFTSPPLSMGRPRTVRAGAGTLAGTNREDGGSYEVSWSFSGTPRQGLTADPGGPYKVKRAGRAKLDGSGSKPRRRITDYIWRFRPIPGECEDVPSRTTRKEGRATSVVALCDVRATLTVVDRDGDRDSETTTVEVRPRGPKGWRTPFSHREKKGDPRMPRDPPSATLVGEGRYSFDLIAGVNVSDCSERAAGSEILCPLNGRGRSWLGEGYELAKVNDPNGPFDGFLYVASSQLRVKMAGLINPTILPGSPFYQHNVGAGRDVAGFVKANSQHEGLGNGTPRSGHSQIIKEITRSPTGDARRVIEQLFASDPDRAQKRVDRALHAIERRLDRESADPLAQIWGPSPLDFFDAYQQKWITAPDITVPIT